MKKERNDTMFSAKKYLSLVMILFVFGLLISSCANRPTINPEGPYWMDNDMKEIAEPSFKEPPMVWYSFKRTTFDQFLELLDMDRNVRKISGHMTQSKNVNCLDEVPNSSWFTNRHGYPTTRMTPDEIKKGPSLTNGPDTSGLWYVFRPKVGGATPGFWIEDSKGNQYVIKFDPLENPEMATAAGTMGSRYFYACGYNVPQESIVYWRPENLRVREGATIKDDNGDKHPLTMEDINAILERVHREANGTIRSLASLNIGNVKGPFMYNGTRSDDANDWCPHQHRRDLRGLYVIGSLINHYDMKDHNSMDVYVGEDGSGYLKHYLMDFGSTFGSDGKSIKHPRKGYANFFDLRDVGVSTITLGTKSWAWEKTKTSPYPSIGHFESEVFEPHKFDAIKPNPAFEQMTYQDAYWGAKIVMAFSDEDIAAFVESGQLSNQEAEDYLIRTLIERRDKIGKFWFSKVNPLDYPEISNNPDELVLKFKDLAVEYKLESGQPVYRYEISYDKEIIDGKSDLGSTSINVSGDVYQKMVSKYRPDVKDNFYKVNIWTNRDGITWSEPAVFWLNYDTNLNQFTIVGIEHPA